jgi:hypothetical protein
MNTPVTTNETSIPAELRSWIADLCQGRAAISVGHRMFAVDENISNIPVEELMYLIRTSAAVKEFVGADESRQQLIAVHVAECISQHVLARFTTARYPGD